MLGSLANVYAVLLPEQQALGVIVSVSGPMQVHVLLLPVQVLEVHCSLAVHAPPLGCLAWQVPPALHGMRMVPERQAQKLDVQSSSTVQEAPSAPRLAQILPWPQ